jgi:hypothetical protein
MSDIETVIEDMIDARISNAVDTAVDNALDNKLDDAVDNKLDDIKSELESKYDDVEGKCDDVESKCDDIESRVDDLEGKDSLDTTAIVDRLDQLELRVKNLDPRIEEAMIGVNRNLGIKNELATLLTRVINLVEDIT